MHRRATISPAFTLIEMIVVVAIVGILLLITFPTLAILTKHNRAEAGTNTIEVAVALARAFAPRKVPSLGIINPSFPSATYSGTAIIFTPGGEIRLVENDQVALQPGSTPLEPSFNGYADIADRDYVKMPQGAAVVGITRAGAGENGLKLLPPPFAVRFDENGYLVVGDPANADDRTVFYDANSNGLYDITKTRSDPWWTPPSTSQYEPAYWDPGTIEYNEVAQDDSTDTPGIHPDTKRQKLPFEAIESVAGMLVYDQNKFTGDGGTWHGDVPTTGDDVPTTGCGVDGQQACASIDQWLQDNGKAIFFNRYTGTIHERRP